MKPLVFIALVLLSQPTEGQKIKPTEEFSISGEIVNEINFTLHDLEKYQHQKVNDVVITNHLGEQKSIARGLTGILIKELFKNVEFKAESPKIMSEFYLTFIASDGYKVVFSWNEIFNSETGNNIFLITQKEGKKINDMDERILLITTSDFKTGRRNIKGLSKIIVKRVS
jgi:hypothetical protein